MASSNPGLKLLQNLQGGGTSPTPGKKKKKENNPGLDLLQSNLGGPDPKTKGPDFTQWGGVPELIAQRKANNVEITNRGGHHKGGGPSIISRVFDVLSRPAYASAEAVRRTDVHNLTSLNPKDWAKEIKNEAVGAGRGLSGTKKTSYSQVLAERGVKNRAALAVGGIAGDILLDPTTYLGTGLVKAPLEAERVAKGAKAAADAVEAARKAGTLNTIAKDARTAYRAKQLEKAAKGEKVVNINDLIKGARKAGEKAEKKEAARIGKEAIANMTPAQKAALQVKVMGKPILESEKLGKAVSVPGKAFAKTDIGQSLIKHFSSKAALGPLSESKRIFSGRSIGEYENWLKNSDPFVQKFGGWDKIPLTKDEAKAFSHAYEAGPHALHALGPVSSKGVDYGELADAIKRANHDFYLQDVEAGLIDPTKTPELDNYLYHHYNQGSTTAKNAFKAKRVKAIASDAYKPASERKIESLAQAAEKGFKPEEDIRSIMMKRAGKGFSGSARSNFIMDAVDQYGVQLDKKAADQLKGQGHDLVNLKNQLKKSIKKEDHEKMLSFLPDDVYVHRQIAEHLGSAERVYRTPEEFEKYVKLFDNIQNKWRSAATVYNPGHHIRNLASDVFLNFLDGTVSPVPYEQALKIMSGKAANGFTKIGGHSVSNIDLLREFRESGAAPGWIMTHVDDGSKLFKGRITNTLHHAASQREEFGRFAHWLDALKKESKGKNLKNLADLREAGQAAAKRVRHWNIDYTELTPFERTFMKRAIPFYTWTRHSTPLMLQALATRPGRLAVVPKGMRALDTLLGIPPGEKLPEDMIPKWIREMGGMQVGSVGGNPLELTPPLPPFETAQYGEGGTQGVLSNLLSQLTPVVRAPAELAMGRTFYGNMPIKSTKDYLLNQVPAARTFNTVRSNQGDPTKNDTWVRLLNYLTGAGLHEVTPNQIKGELHRQIDQQQAYLRKARKRG